MLGPSTSGPGVGAEELWRHADPQSTPMWKFMQHINSTYGLSLDSYPRLYKWSVDQVPVFWAEVWRFVGVRASRPYDEVIPPDAPMFPRPDFFSGALLNFAENLLLPTGPPGGAAATAVKGSDVAVITATEREDQVTHTSWDELRDEVRRCAAALRAAGVGVGPATSPPTVVAGFVSNHLQALVAMLAAASLGAVWTGISPDNGVSAVLGRLDQIGPRVLFADNASLYNAKAWSCREKTLQVVRGLGGRGLERLVVVNAVDGVDMGLEDLRATGVRVDEYDNWLRSAPDQPLTFVQLPPSHPLYVLFSSGTTGLPKAIVHTAAGTLLQHKKELLLHCSMSPSSRMLYYTTTSWMMWHWSVSALSVGASLVLYTGSPFRPHAHLSLPRLLSALRVTHFGTSAAYLTALEAAGVRPAAAPSPVDDHDQQQKQQQQAHLDLSRLEAIFSTASPLPPSTFRFVYDGGAFPPRAQLASITGGTDIISLFGAPCPLLPVRVGEIQCAGLGMAIGVVDPDADPSSGTQAIVPRLAGLSSSSPSSPSSPESSSTTGSDLVPGDLVCVRPFPSQPLTFWGPGGDEKYRAAYFGRFPGVWHHGDFVRLDLRTGALVMLGRSDGVLKPSGVRFGSAEIYNILTKFFPAEVEDAVCVGRRRATDSDEIVCLFVVTRDGHPFTEDLRRRIASAIRTELSPRHVPGIIDECGGGVPKTGNGKKIEVAVKQILSGVEVKTNASVANPAALDWFREWARRHTTE